MNEKETFIGGLRAGTYNCTAPFAKVAITSDQFFINALGRKFQFTPNDIIGFKKRNGGIQVHHIKKEYPNLIIFWCNPDKVLQVIKTIGFIPCAPGGPDSDDEYELHKYLHLVGFGFLAFIIVLAITLMIISK